MDNSTEESKRNKELSIASITNRLDINNICMFYTISFFYAHREIDGIGTSGNFDFENYYCKNSNYRNSIIKDFADFYLQETIDIIQELVPNGSNVNNWIRSEKNQDVFMQKVNNKIISINGMEKHKKFMEKYLINR